MNSRTFFLLLLVSLFNFSLAEDILFKYIPPTSIEVESVSLRGDFNNWSETIVACLF